MTNRNSCDALDVKYTDDYTFPYSYKDITNEVGNYVKYTNTSIHIPDMSKLKQIISEHFPDENMSSLIKIYREWVINNAKNKDDITEFIKTYKQYINKRDVMFNHVKRYNNQKKIMLSYPGLDAYETKANELESVENVDKYRNKEYYYTRPSSLYNIPML